MENHEARAFALSQAEGNVSNKQTAWWDPKRAVAQAEKATFFQGLALVYIPLEEKLTRIIKLMEIFQAVQDTENMYLVLSLMVGTI